MELCVDIGDYFTMLEDRAITLSCDAIGMVIDELVGDGISPEKSPSVDQYIGKLIEECAMPALVYAALYNQYSDGSEWLDTIDDWVYGFVIDHFDELITYDGDSEDRRYQVVHSVSRRLPNDFDIRSSKDVQTIAELIAEALSDALAEMGIFDEPDFIEFIDHVDYPILRVLERKISFDDVITIDLREQYAIVKAAD